MPTREVQYSDRELRLGVVAYGGVSLAIYMHGVTRELHKLVLASRAYEMQQEDPSVDMRARLTDSEQVYFDELKLLHHSTGIALSVVIDVISGTSAGAINAACLAKGLACYQPQQSLRDLWLRRGDIRQLLNGLPVPLLGIRMASALLNALVLRHAPLRGDEMIRWLYDAFIAMDRAPSDRQRLGDEAASLVPADETLDLFMTTTDLRGYPRLVATGTGGPMQEDVTYRHVLSFTHDPGSGAPSALSDPVPLAFAARASSSIPGAFEPLTLDRFAEALSKAEEPPAAPLERLKDLFREYECAGIRASQQVFADGGLLENAPFSHVINAVAAKPARSEVIRRIIYLEPDPVSHDLSASRPAPPQEAAGPPGPLAAVWQTVQGPRGHQDLLSDLLRLRDLNERIEQVAAIATDQMPHVMAEVSAVLDRCEWPLRYETLATSVVPAVRDKVIRQGGEAYPVYEQLKLLAVARWLADTIVTNFHYPADASQASFIRSVMWSWLSSHPWGRTLAAGSDPAQSPLGDIFRDRASFLATLDIPYRERRLRFVIAGINALYGNSGADRAKLGRLKKAAYGILTSLRDLGCLVLPADYLKPFGPDALTQQRWLQDPGKVAEELGVHLDDFARAFASQLSGKVADGGRALWDEFSALTADWPGADTAWRSLVARYVGYPAYDTVIYPLIALSELPQFTSIGVRRFSPFDAKAPLTIPPKGKLCGVSFRHFGAFLDLKSRQNDYLWGRLDAMQQITELLGSLADGKSTAPLERLMWAGLKAVLESENDLDKIRPERVRLTRDVAAHLSRPTDVIGP